MIIYGIASLEVPDTQRDVVLVSGIKIPSAPPLYVEGAMLPSGKATRVDALYPGDKAPKPLNDSILLHYPALYVEATVDENVPYLNTIKGSIESGLSFFGLVVKTLDTGLHQTTYKSVRYAFNAIKSSEIEAIFLVQGNRRPEQLVHLDTPAVPTLDPNRYPHTCKICGAPAYVGFALNNVDCSNPKCVNYRG